MPKQRAMEQRCKVLGNMNISGGGDSIAPKVPKPERIRKKTKTRHLEADRGHMVSRRDEQPTWKMQPDKKERCPLIWKYGRRQELSGGG